MSKIMILCDDEFKFTIFNYCSGSIIDRPAWILILSILSKTYFFIKLFITVPVPNFDKLRFRFQLCIYYLDHKSSFKKIEQNLAILMLIEAALLTKNLSCHLM
jgi:hypothetical protein